MIADVETLHKTLEMRIKQYRMQNKRDPCVESIAQFLSNTLYGRRFFPTMLLTCSVALQRTERVLCSAMMLSAHTAQKATVFKVQGPSLVCPSLTISSKATTT